MSNTSRSRLWLNDIPLPPGGRVHILETGRGRSVLHDKFRRCAAPAICGLLLWACSCCGFCFALLFVRMSSLLVIMSARLLFSAVISEYVEPKKVVQKCESRFGNWFGHCINGILSDSVAGNLGDNVMSNVSVGALGESYDLSWHAQ